MAPVKENKVDLRRYRPNEPLQPSKGKKKAVRPFTRDSNLTDLLGTDIFGGQVATDKKENALLRPSEKKLAPQPPLKRNPTSANQMAQRNQNHLGRSQFAKQPPLDQTRYKQPPRHPNPSSKLARSHRNISEKAQAGPNPNRPTSSQTNQGPLTPKMPSRPIYPGQGQSQPAKKPHMGPSRGFPGR